jgi:predicted kinase
MWYKKSNLDKVLVVLRGIPGSGKSYTSQEISGDSNNIFSTDDYFMQGGNYVFDPSKLPTAHRWNQQRAIEAMDAGVTPIIIDNTNVQAWEAKGYVQAAIDRGYRIEIREPETPWKFDAEELAKRNQHGVPIEAIKRMLSRWEPDITVDDILAAKSPFDKGK